MMNKKYLFITFFLILILTPLHPVLGAPTLRNSYYAGYQAKTLVWGTDHSISQAFTVGSTGYSVTGVEFSGFTIAGYDGGNLIINIYLADVNHKPTGASLTSGSMDCTDITDVDNSPVAYIIPVTPVNLSANTEYCLVFSNDNASYACYLIQDTGGAGGAFTTADSGSTWDALTGWTFYYGVWGNDAEAPAPETSTETVATTILETTLVTTHTTLTPGTSTIDITLTGGTSTITTSTTLEGPNGTTISVIISQIVTNTISSLYSVTELAAGTITGFETTCLTSTSIYETSTTTCSTYKTSTTTCSTFETCTTTCLTAETVVDTCTTLCSTFETCTTSCVTSESITTTCTTTSSTINTVTSIVTTCTTNTKVVGSTTTTTTTSGSGAIGGDTNILILPLAIGAILTVLFVALGRRRR